VTRTQGLQCRGLPVDTITRAGRTYTEEPFGGRTVCAQSTGELRKGPGLSVDVGGVNGSVSEHKCSSPESTPVSPVCKGRSSYEKTELMLPNRDGFRGACMSQCLLVKATRMAITSVASNQLSARPGARYQRGTRFGCLPSGDDA
jgi:hypothetical protein